MGKIRKTYIPGTIYNHLTFIKETRTKNKKRYGLFKCACGKEKEIGISNVITGGTKSCSCKWLSYKIKHGDGKRKNIHYLYSTYRTIIQRCYNPKTKSYKNYGGRGIGVSILWQREYIIFKEYVLKFLGERPNGMTLDRIDNEKDYEPGNIRWATISMQNNNRRKYNPSDVL